MSINIDWKVKSYQSFCGEFLQTSVKISQKIIDEMEEDDLIELRLMCSKFERELFNFVRHYAAIISDSELFTGEEKNAEAYIEETTGAMDAIDENSRTRRKKDSAS